MSVSYIIPNFLNLNATRNKSSVTLEPLSEALYPLCDNKNLLYNTLLGLRPIIGGNKQKTQKKQNKKKTKQTRDIIIITWKSPDYFFVYADGDPDDF